MKVTIIPIVNGAFGIVTNELQKEMENLEVGGRVETIQTTALLRKARILRKIMETKGNLLSLKKRPPAITDMKNSHDIIIMIIIIITTAGDTTGSVR